MRWFRVDKAIAVRPNGGTYKDWKPHLRQEAQYQCVYCAIHEACFGGERNFHVEHFKPKSRFKTLINRYDNLFYSCAICNTFKGSQWPGHVGNNFSLVGFIDPSKVDYCAIFSVDAHAGLLSAGNNAGRFMIEQLYLNRPQLLSERRIASAVRALSLEQARLQAAVQSWEDSGCPPAAGRLIAKAVKALIATANLLSKARKVVPYQPSDVRR
ncbi:MAG: hypothetical protein NTY77_06045 [Elusimicrobia bacterium]|nr:hypothetical protein [Elusimicrobiota bacterium]